MDGQRVDMTAYSIGGNNYVRLRDIGRAVDFGVIYNTATNSVYLDSTQPYQKVRWGGQYFKWWLEEQPGYAMYTRYPQ